MARSSRSRAASNPRDFTSRPVAQVPPSLRDLCFCHSEPLGPVILNAVKNPLFALRKHPAAAKSSPLPRSPLKAHGDMFKRAGTCLPPPPPPVKFFSFSLLICVLTALFVLNPSPALAYTYQNVMDFVKQQKAISEPACANKLVWAEPFTDASGADGYRVFKRCDDTRVVYEIRSEITGSTYATPDNSIYDRQFGFYYYICGTGGTAWGFGGFIAGDKQKTYYMRCDGKEEIITQTFGITISASPCPLPLPRRWLYVDCGTTNVLLAEFIPMDKCVDKTTGLYAPCGRCSDPAGLSYTGSAPEVCDNGIDDNCNGEIDEGCGPKCEDKDGDGFFAKSATCPDGNDCNDNDVNTNPGAKETCGDGVDNNCNGEADGKSEGCYVLKKESGDGQTDKICKELKDPLAAIAEGSGGAPEIIWAIKSGPAADKPAELGGVTTLSDATGLHSYVTLKLGSLPGAYTTEASCAICKDSPVTFTATAECPAVTAQYQGDYAQAYDTLCKKTTKPYTPEKPGPMTCTGAPGEVKWPISSKGCALTAAAMVMRRHGYVMPDTSTDPDPANLNGLANESGGYQGEGNFDFAKVADYSSPQLKLVYWPDAKWDEDKKSYIPLDKSLMDTFLARCIPAMVYVRYPDKTSPPSHWVVVTEKKGSDYTINDPAGKHALLSQYGDIYKIRVLENKDGGCR